MNIFISGSTDTNRRKRRQGQRQSKISASDVQLYKDLSQASGGQAIQVDTGDLETSIGIITELSSSASLVTPPKPRPHPEVWESPPPGFSRDL